MARQSKTEHLDGGRNSITDSQISRRSVLRGAVAATALTMPVSPTAFAQEATPTAGQDQQVRVFPIPGTKLASPGSQITFRGVDPDSLGPVNVTASDSGVHSGTLLAHSDGRGVSWIPDFSFRPGETVTVTTRLDIANSEKGDFSFTCAEPRAGRAKPERSGEADEADIWRFRSRPGLAPPRVKAELYEGKTAPGYIFLAAKRGGGRNGALIVDNQGDPVWFFPVDVETHQIYDFKVAEFQGEPMLLWWQGISVSGQGSGHWVISDNAYEPVATIRIGNGFDGGDMHDIALTAQNTAIVGAYSTIRWDLSSMDGLEAGFVIDCVVQEIDIATGAVMFEWHSLDHVDLDETKSEIEDEEKEAPFDYFHCNSVAVDGDDNIVISGRNTWTTYKLDRNSGEVIWRFGGKKSDFAMGEGAETAWQHDAVPWPDSRLTIFDNGASPKVHEESRGVVVSLDMDDVSASLSQEYLHPDHVSAGAQGNMQTLGNGNVLIGWGSEPLVSEFAADGTLLFDLHLPKEKQSYRAYRFEWNGRPQTSPTVLAEPAGDGQTTVFASWNGATGVSAWRVLAGDTEGDMKPLPEPTPRTGFETEIVLTSPSKFFAIEALDADGKVLGTSKAIDATS